SETTKPSREGFVVFPARTARREQSGYRANEVYGVGVLPVGHFVSPVTGEKSRQWHCAKPQLRGMTHRLEQRPAPSDEASRERTLITAAASCRHQSRCHADSATASMHNFRAKSHPRATQLGTLSNVFMAPLK